MGYDDDECAYCYAYYNCNNKINDDEEGYYLTCYFCVGKMSDDCSNARFTNGIMSSSTCWDDTECFLCGKGINSGYNVTFCESHRNEWKRNSNDSFNENHSNTNSSMKGKKVYVLLENEKFCAIYEDESAVKNIIMTSNKSNFKVVESLIT